MKFEQVKSLKEEAFRRLTGVKRRTFDTMIDVLEKKENRKKARGGKPNNLSLENRLLMTLEYLREYRTYFHISQSYGLSESACYRNIRWVEDTLIKSRLFFLRRSHPFDCARRSSLRSGRTNFTYFFQ